MDQPGKVANPARGQLNRENNIPLSPCVPENLVSRDGIHTYIHTYSVSMSIFTSVKNDNRTCSERTYVTKKHDSTAKTQDGPEDGSRFSGRNVDLDKCASKFFRASTCSEKVKNVFQMFFNLILKMKDRVSCSSKTMRHKLISPLPLFREGIT